MAQWTRIIGTTTRRVGHVIAFRRDCDVTLSFHTTMLLLLQLRALPFLRVAPRARTLAVSLRTHIPTFYSTAPQNSLRPNVWSVVCRLGISCILLTSLVLSFNCASVYGPTNSY